MGYRRLYSLYAFVLFLSLSLIQLHIVRAEHASSTGTAGTRPAAPEALTPEILQFLKSKVNSSEPYLKSLFRITPTLSMGLAAAIEKAIGGEEDPSAAIISEFLGQLGQPQIQALADEKTAAPGRGCGEKEASNASRLDAIVTRMRWAARRVLGITDPLRPKCLTPEDVFVSSFDKFWPTTVQHNQRVHALKTKALEGDTKALDELKTLVDASALPGFLQQQALGNGAQGDQIVGDLGKLLFENLNGKYFANLSHLGGGAAARVAFGGDPSKFGSVIREVNGDASFGDLGAYGLSATAIAGAREVSPRAAGGPGVQPPPGTGTGGTGTGGTGTGGTGTGSGMGTGTGTTQPPPPPTDDAAAKAAAVLSAKCGPCHKPGGSQYRQSDPSKFRIGDSGQLVDQAGSPLSSTSPTFSTLIQQTFVRTVQGGGDGPMPPAGLLPESERQTLSTWLTSQGAR